MLMVVLSLSSNAMYCGFTLRGVLAVVHTLITKLEYFTVKRGYGVHVAKCLKYVH